MINKINTFLHAVTTWLDDRFFPPKINEYHIKLMPYTATEKQRKTLLKLNENHARMLYFYMIIEGGLSIGSMKEAVQEVLDKG